MLMARRSRIYNRDKRPYRGLDGGGLDALVLAATALSFGARSEPRVRGL
jgi:hypothetical protein